MEQVTLWLNADQHRMLYQSLQLRKQQIEEKLEGKSHFYCAVMQHEIKLMNQMLTQLADGTVLKPDPMLL